MGAISTQKLQITRTPPQRTTETESHSTLAYTTLCTFTPLLFCLCFCFALFPIQGLCQFGPRSHHRQNMYHQPEHVGHWEGLEMWLSATTNSILPKAAEALQHQTQDQLDDNITSIMRQDPSQNYNHKELAKITSSLSHTLIATLKLSDKHAAQRQQELTSAQRRIEQLERERQEGTDEEINRLKETLEATSHEMQQLKEDFADRADKLQYAEKLLEKAKTDFRDKNSRIKALEAHLAESRNEISRLTQQLDYVTEESESFQEDLKHAYELRREPSRTGRAPAAPLPSRTKSPVPGLTREHKTEGVMLKQSPAPSEELYITTEPEESAAASRRSSHSLDLKDLDKLARNVRKFNPSVPNSQTVQAYLQDIDFHLEMRPNVTDKDKLYLLRTTSSPEVRSFLDRQPVNTKTDYQRLRKALIKEFADPESDQGLVAALETRQGRHDTPQAYYSRLRQAYFGTRNDSDMEDELNFKTLFLRNLHPGISHHLGVLACPRTMNTQQLRDLVQKAYYKQKMASEKSTKTPAVLDFNTQHHELALEGTQRQDSAKPPHREWNALPSNRERDSHADTRPEQRYDRWDEPCGRQRSPGRHWEKWSHENQWEKEDEPESAWLAVRRNGSDKLNKSAPENSTASPCSQRTVNTLTSDGHETPPENPATELNTNSTPNTPNHSSIQQTPADETPQVPESAVSATCHSSGEHQIRSDIQTFPPKLQPLKWPKRCPHHSRCITWRVLDLSCPPTQPYSGSSNPPPARHWRAHPCPPALPYHLSSLLTISSPSHADSSLRTMTAHMSKPCNTSSELRKLHSVDYMLHLQDGVHTYVPQPLTAPQLVVPHGQRGSTLTHAHDAPWWVASANRQIQTTDRKRGKIRPTDTDRQPYAPHKHNYCHFRKTYSNHA